MITLGVYDGSAVLAHLGLPEDLSGQRMLEIGRCDGYFTKQLTTRSVSVTPFDYTAKDFFGFAAMEQLHGAPFEFIQGNLYDLPKFDMRPFVQSSGAG